MERPSILIAGLRPEQEAAVAASAAGLGLEVVQAVGWPEREAPSSPRPALAVVSIERDAEAGFRLVSALAGAGVRVAVLAPAKQPELILRAMRAGAREFVAANEHERLEAVVRNLAISGAAAALGTVTTVFPAKGGMGATVLAANLAGALAARHERVCLLDLDLALGDAMALLDLTGGYSISDTLANMRRLDRDLLDSAVARHRSGVAVVAQSEHIDETERVDARGVARLLGFLRGHYGHLVIDGIRGFDEIALAALDGSDRVLLVVTQEIPSVRNARRCVEIFHRLGYSEEKVKLVVNRFQRGARIDAGVIAETVGIPVTATVSNDFPLFTRAAERGALLVEVAPRSLPAKDVAALVEVVSRKEPEAAPRRASFLGRWLAPKVASDGT